MPSEATKALPGSASSFAKLFAGLTRSKSENDTAHSDSWIDEALAEDVATISYEQALRAHARYRHTEPLPPAPPEHTDPTVPKPPQSVRITEWAPNDTSAALAASRKLSSITIRMSRAECEQLRQRAAAAGLTVSAYLRSCIFEVEALRAQVKDALSELHSEPGQPRAQHSENRDKPASADWRARLFAHWPRSRNRADA
jgi:predicted DNA binding CopG/RHH family protein